MMRPHAIALLGLACCPLLAASQTAAMKTANAPWQVKLSEGASGPLSTKPAELFFLSQDGEDSAAINASISGYKRLDFLANRYAEPEFQFGGSIAKTDLKSSPNDLRAVHLGLVTEWTPLQGTYLAARTSINVAAEEDREKHTRGRSSRLDLSLVSVCADPNFDEGERGLYFKCSPYAGYYHRKITHTDDALLAPLGSHGGAFAGLLLRMSFGKVKDYVWWAPVELEVNAYWLKDSHATNGYANKRYDYTSATLSYALYASDKSAWKPRISVVRETGTDRLNNKSKTASTKVGLQIGYNI